MNSTVFENSLKVTPLTSNTYSVDLSKDWCIGNVPHGGYTTAVLHRTATIHFARKNPKSIPISFQLSFLRHTRVGPAIITIKDSKIGQRTSSIHVSLSQTRTKPGEAPREEEKLAGYITLGLESAEQGPIAKSSWTLHPPSAPGSRADGSIDLAALANTGHDGRWIRYPQRVYLSAHQHDEIYGPNDRVTLEEATMRTVDQWARFRPGGQLSRWTNESLMYLVDISPKGLERLGAMMMSATGSSGSWELDKGSLWYPTVTFNVDIKKPLPAEGVEWLYSRVETKTLRGGRADLDVVVLDEAGDLVAIASMVSLVVDATRNVGIQGGFNPVKL
ncbi:hypothetical protein ASPWEDRAFT_73146 [Aspergillus wentii DTO 134E9]|uniref:Thioesterase domain-containing protein n=1 Tax=Aspergillus wentii DTO 134E9 TaxID=1073089 RepID=A0A1L9R469_ASPWE|nr:uncharacterized protein ASPWEDRAFT_73146 [Aspergillus wentii DTO 134E9]KAI9926994.1 hypothetical protein MW887_003375 [Aspergillus wentii]OJJ29708.1 hypothetical protein ASPWEDRAFT_73146 [Aspergillus wentii DTO 134E9]